MELQDGQSVWLAWSHVPLGGDSPMAYVERAEVVNANAKLVKTERGAYRQVLFMERIVATEAEARTIVAAELESVAEKIAAVARVQRQQAAQASAKAGVAVYA